MMKFTLLVTTAAAAVSGPVCTSCKDPFPVCQFDSIKATEDDPNPLEKRSCVTKDICDALFNRSANGGKGITVKCTDLKAEAAAAKKLADAKKESATTGIKVITAAVISLIAIM